MVRQMYFQTLRQFDLALALPPEPKGSRPSIPTKSQVRRALPCESIPDANLAVTYLELRTFEASVVDKVRKVFPAQSPMPVLASLLHISCIFMIDFRITLRPLVQASPSSRRKGCDQKDQQVSRRRSWQ